MSGQDSMISIQHLSKCFGDNEVLKDVNIEIAKGEVVVVLGPSGSGKSTMLRCINLLEKPTGGHIFIEGKEITDPKTDVNKLPASSSYSTRTPRCSPPSASWSSCSTRAPSSRSRAT